MMMDKLIEAVKEKKLVIGTKVVHKSIKPGCGLNEVFLASNCPVHMRNRIKTLAELANIPVKELEQTSEEIGALCKKTFGITVAAIRKMKEQ